MSDPMNPNLRPSRQRDPNAQSDPRSGNLGPRTNQSWLLLPAVILLVLLGYWTYEKYADAPVSPTGMNQSMTKAPAQDAAPATPPATGSGSSMAPQKTDGSTAPATP